MRTIAIWIFTPGVRSFMHSVDSSEAIGFFRLRSAVSGVHPTLQNLAVPAPGGGNSIWPAQPPQEAGRGVWTRCGWRPGIPGALLVAAWASLVSRRTTRVSMQVGLPEDSGVQGVSRRALLLAASAVVLAPAAASATSADSRSKVGYACRADESCGMSQSATKAFTESSVAGRAGIRFGGTYSDPNHPGCNRKITLQGGGAIITGADEDKKKFKLKGTVNGKALYIDFSPKGGPEAVRAEWNGLGLVFPDGNVWTKLP